MGGDDELSEQQRITKTEEKSFQNEANFYHHCSTTAESERLRLAAAAVHLPECPFKGITTRERCRSYFFACSHLTFNTDAKRGKKQKEAGSRGKKQKKQEETNIFLH